MTKLVAQIEAERGRKVTHRYFSNDEYVTMKNGILLDEKGNHLDFGDFWAIRNSDAWKTDWSFFEEKNNPKQ